MYHIRTQLFSLYILLMICFLLIDYFIVENDSGFRITDSTFSTI